MHECEYLPGGFEWKLGLCGGWIVRRNPQQECWEWFKKKPRKIKADSCNSLRKSTTYWSRYKSRNCRKRTQGLSFPTLENREFENFCENSYWILVFLAEFLSEKMQFKRKRSKKMVIKERDFGIVANEAKSIAVRGKQIQRKTPRRQKRSQSPKKISESDRKVIFPSDSWRNCRQRSNPYVSDRMIFHQFSSNTL